MVEIEPSELSFYSPFNKSINYLSLANRTDKWVSYKIQTTAPRRYCVKPHILGLLRPHQSRNLQVKLDITKDPPSSIRRIMKNPDKFQIKSLVLEKQPPPDADIASFLKHIWNVTPHHMVSTYKIKCTLIDLESHYKNINKTDKVEIKDKPNQEGSLDDGSLVQINHIKKKLLPLIETTPNFAVHIGTCTGTGRAVIIALTLGILLGSFCI